jgi:hypothetical protein
MDQQIEKEHLPIFWGIVLFIIGVSALLLWHRYSVAS